MRPILIIAMIFVVSAMLLPQILHAQGMAQTLTGMQPVLDQVYDEMLPLCSKLIDVARGIAGFGALWYIASRVWRQIASAEPIDFYPLLRPFALGMAILMFPLLIALMNGVLKPTVMATGAMVRDSDKVIAALLKQKEKAVKDSKFYEMYVGNDGHGNSDKWYRYTHPQDPNRENEGMFEGIGNDIKFWMDKQSYNFRNSIKQWMSEVLQVLFAAASLCINTIRTFYLIVLAILGPLVFGFAVFDGLQHTLTQWIARYTNVFLWLPVANIFGSIMGKIQENMLKIDIGQIHDHGDTFFSSTDTGYLIFLIIGIIGYFTVPNVANYIVHAGGANTLLQKVTTMVAGGAGAVVSGGASQVSSSAGNLMNAGQHFNEGYSGDREGAGMHGSLGRTLGKAGGYLHDKLSGK